MIILKQYLMISLAKYKCLLAYALMLVFVYSHQALCHSDSAIELDKGNAYMKPKYRRSVSVNEHTSSSLEQDRIHSDNNKEYEYGALKKSKEYNYIDLSGSEYNTLPIQTNMYSSIGAQSIPTDLPNISSNGSFDTYVYVKCAVINKKIAIEWHKFYLMPLSKEEEEEKKIPLWCRLEGTSNINTAVFQAKHSYIDLNNYKLVQYYEKIESNANTDIYPYSEDGQTNCTDRQNLILSAFTLANIFNELTIDTVNAAVHIHIENALPIEYSGIYHLFRNIVLYGSQIDSNIQTPDWSLQNMSTKYKSLPVTHLASLAFTGFRGADILDVSSAIHYPIYYKDKNTIIINDCNISDFSCIAKQHLQGEATSLIVMGNMNLDVSLQEFIDLGVGTIDLGMLTCPSIFKACDQIESLNSAQNSSNLTQSNKKDLDTSLSVKNKIKKKIFKMLSITPPKAPLNHFYLRLSDLMLLLRIIDGQKNVFIAKNIYVVGLKDVIPNISKIIRANIIQNTCVMSMLTNKVHIYADPLFSDNLTDSYINDLLNLIALLNCKDMEEVELYIPHWSEKTHLNSILSFQPLGVLSMLNDHYHMDFPKFINASQMFSLFKEKKYMMVLVDQASIDKLPKCVAVNVSKVLILSNDVKISDARINGLFNEPDVYTMRFTLKVFNGSNNNFTNTGVVIAVPLLKQIMHKIANPESTQIKFSTKNHLNQNNPINNIIALFTDIYKCDNNKCQFVCPGICNRRFSMFKPEAADSDADSLPDNSSISPSISLSENSESSLLVNYQSTKDTSPPFVQKKSLKDPITYIVVHDMYGASCIDCFYSYFQYHKCVQNNDIAGMYLKKTNTIKTNNIDMPALCMLIRGFNNTLRLNITSSVLKTIISNLSIFFQSPYIMVYSDTIPTEELHQEQNQPKIIKRASTIIRNALRRQSKYIQTVIEGSSALSYPLAPVQSEIQ
ncbi:hypothetical protein NEOKW01_1314 [Nematocida sp. AWRm80]|nr:hypothetical protein NEOKW01_1314 [Nematocida sp. AWRm80]